MLIAIDPGNLESAYVIVDQKFRPLDFGKVNNEILRDIMPDLISQYHVEAAYVEMVASYGMAVGQEVFETCVWIGRYIEQICRYIDSKCVHKVYRKDVKLHICGSMRAKDANIRQALIDRFGKVGTKKAPGWFYGFKADIWSAYAVAVASEMAAG